MTFLVEQKPTTSLLKGLFLLILGCTLSGCFIPDEESDTPEPPAPTAAVRLIHLDTMRGSVDIFKDGVRLTSASFGEVSPAIEIELGDSNLSLKQSGAQSAFYESELLQIEERVYDLILVGDAAENGPVVELTEAPPAPEEGQHWVRIIDLSDIEEGKILRGGMEVLTSLPAASDGSIDSGFKATTAAASTRMSITATFDGTDFPQKTLEAVPFPSGGASLVLITGSVSDENIDMIVEPLDLDRLTLNEPMMSVDP